MWSLMTDVCRAMGVRTDIPYKDLTDEEKEIVLHGPPVKKHIFYKNEKTNNAGELDFTYYSATYTVENSLAKVKDEKGMKRVEKFLKQEVCTACGGTRLSDEARAPRLLGKSLDQVCTLTLKDLNEWVRSVPSGLPEEMRPMAESICESFLDVSKRLMDLGLGYLSLDRAASTLSTGERQRMQLARSVRNRTSGVLYVLDEPSIGLHPANIVGLKGVMHDLVDDGNSVILVDHDPQILSESDWIIELGPGSGSMGGRVINEGTVRDIVGSGSSLIGPFLSEERRGRHRPSVPERDLFSLGTISMATNPVHTVKPLNVTIPKGRMTLVTGVSGSGKTTMVLESLVPGLQAAISGGRMPDTVVSIDAPGISHVKLIDATPIGINVRSTVATYSNVHDELRKAFAKCQMSKDEGLKAGDFSYNTGDLRCAVCDGTGAISLDVQFLPDVDIPCPECRGSRYSKRAERIRRLCGDGKEHSISEIMEMDVATALDVCSDMKAVSSRLRILNDIGLGYLVLGEATPNLSGGEAQRLKLASEMGQRQDDSLFVFDEPTIGLHPSDVLTLMDVFQNLIDNGATVVVIEHDLDMIRNADYIIDMGPGGGEDGGTIVSAGTPEHVASDGRSVTGKLLKGCM
jgi:excinuclease ABC subunit A